MKRGVIYTRTSSRTTFNKTSVFRQSEGYSDDMVVFSDNCKDVINLKERPYFNNMLDYIREEKIDTLYMESIDRIGRDTEILLEGQTLLKSAGIVDVVCKENYFKDFLNTPREEIEEFSKFQVYSKKVLVAKLQGIKRITKEKVGKSGGNPLTYKRYINDPRIYEIIKENLGKVSLRKLGLILESQGYLTSKGTCISVSTLHKICKELRGGDYNERI